MASSLSSTNAMPKTKNSKPTQVFVKAIRGQFGIGTYLTGEVQKFYCGNCGHEEITAKPTTLVLFQVLPDGEDSWICKDRNSCRRNCE